MLEVIPKGWFRNDYEIIHNGERIVDIHQTWFREEGELTILGETYHVRKPGMRGVFLLEQNGVTVARAEKPSALKRTMFVDYNGVRYTLRPESTWRRRFVLQVGDHVMGSIERRNGWSRKARVQFPDLPLPVVIFMTWLVIMLWGRDDTAAVMPAVI
jgi:hypothetical protein